MSTTKSQQTRIAIFDDSAAAEETYRKLFEGHRIMVKKTMRVDALKDELLDFAPQLLVVDLVLETSRYDGFDLIRQLREIDELQSVPIVVCSKQIDSSELGRRLAQQVGRLPGVKAVLSKNPYPPAREFLLPLAAASD